MNWIRAHNDRSAVVSAVSRRADGAARHAHAHRHCHTGWSIFVFVSLHKINVSPTHALATLGRPSTRSSMASLSETFAWLVRLPCVYLCGMTSVLFRIKTMPIRCRFFQVQRYDTRRIPTVLRRIPTLDANKGHLPQN